MNKQASGCVTLSVGRVALAVASALLITTSNASAQNAVGWPSGNASVRGNQLSNVRSLRCGVNHAIALLADGTVTLRGANANFASQLCSDPDGCDFISIAAGYKHAIALRSDGVIVGVGINTSGETVAPAGLTDATSLAAGNRYSGAVRANGTVAMWGSNQFGKSIAPAGLDQVIKLSLGQDHSVALRANGEVRCWGRTTYGAAPSTVLDAATGAPILAKDVAAGDKHTIVLRENGTVQGLGYFKNALPPLVLTNVAAVSAGVGQSLALRADGAIYSWGASKSIPPQVGEAFDVSAGKAFAYALVQEGGIAAPELPGLAAAASNCTSVDGSVDLTPSAAPMLWWTGPNGFFSTRRDIAGVPSGRYTVHGRGAGGQVDSVFVIESADAPTWYPDADGDGFGDSTPNAGRRECVQPEGSVGVSGDECDENPNLSSSEEFYADSDGDGFGDPHSELRSCIEVPPPGYVEDDHDCNDEDVEINPQTIWYADLDGDGIGSPIGGTRQQCHQPEGFYRSGNDNCPLNPDLTDPIRFFYDGDHDGFGDPAVFYDACTATPPVGYVINGNDCNDSTAAINPARPELCADRGVDNDCDAATDVDPDASDLLTYYVDADHDGVGSADTAKSCDVPPPTGLSTTTGDNCPLNPALVNPVVYWPDADADLFGNPSLPFPACETYPPIGYVANDDDCNDGDNAVFLGAPELCANDGVDNDCDGEANDDAESSDSVSYYVDGDADGFGFGAATKSCTPIEGSVTNNSDCNDQELQYADTDSDTHGAGAPVACGVASNDDCDDSDAAVYPGAAELCADILVDNDCDGDTSAAEASDSVSYYVDGDHDGFGFGAATKSCTPIEGSVTNNSDCDDASSSTYPGAAELCATVGTDNNCDLNADDVDADASDKQVFYADTDGDGFGDLASPSDPSCSAPAGHVANSSDCDDTQLLYADGDNDTHGAGAPVACGVASNDDCNDSDATVFPGAAELCANDGVDNDCDGGADDDAEASDSVSYYVDGDDDGFGFGAATKSCTPIEGSVTNNSDCDDASSSTYPGAAELCATVGTDNNCDLNADDVDADASDKQVFYADTDGDGFGDLASPSDPSCSAPAGHVANSSDCDDTQLLYADGDNDTHGAGAPVACGVASNDDCNDSDATVFPGAAELCANDGVDNDCDGGADDDAEASDSVSYYVDGDDDGFGFGAATKSCTPIEGSVTNNSDCDDASSSTYPGAAELCATVGTDNNCDLNADDVDADASDKQVFYADTDGDGFGDLASPSDPSCSAPAGHVANSSDCDDTQLLYADGDGDTHGAGAPIACGVASNDDCNDSDATVFPGAAELCANDGVDNDCDGGADDDAEASDSVSYYVDGDDDGFGFGAATKSCTPIEGSVTNNSDCDDASSSTYPGAAELCATVGTDNNCDLNADDVDADASDKQVFYADTDGDGFGDLASPSDPSCSAPAGHVANSSDCDDTQLLYADGDGDTHGAGAPVACGVASNDDCNDSDATVFPGAAELCANDGVDNDCDGGADDDAEASDSVSYYVDGDDDGFGFGAATKSCTPIEGSVTNNSDCDDASSSTYPGAAELCATVGTDNNCDLNADDVDADASDKQVFYADTDGDGFGDLASPSDPSCSAPAGHVANSSDCDDTQLLYADGDGDTHGAGAPVACGVASNDDCNDSDATVYPGAAELCANDGVDNDCDGEADDDAESSDSVSYYVDGDHDGFGFGEATKSCTPIEGSVTNNSDCDDALTTYADVDGDTHGAGAPVACGVASNDDCNDSDATVYPGAAELCANDGVDNDCDGEADDDAESSDSVSYYVDGDHDGFGFGEATKSCTPIEGSVTNNSDCDDALTTYADVDGDTHGAGAPVACGVASNDDCNDSDATVYPGGAELCANDGVDNDCDGEADDDAESSDSVSYYVDGDHDGFGFGEATKSCTPIEGSVTNNSDCDDALTTYADVDGDTHGAGAPVACGVASNDDCNDSDATVYPGAAELCANDGVDNDCDGEANDDAESSDSVSYYADADQDGFGFGAATKSCTPVEGSVTNNSDCDDALTTYADVDGDTHGAGAPVACGVASNDDCNDSDATVYPGAAELCANDGVDNDCDGEANDDAESSDSVSYYADADQDGFGFGAATKSCTPVEGSVTNDSDCDDNLVTYADVDSDTHGAGAPVACGVASNDDCNDSDATVYPGAAELCANDGVDNDCDGEADDDAESSDSVSYHIDADQDGCGFGEATKSCTVISGSVSNADDCDDAQLLYVDADGDTHGAGAPVCCGVPSSDDCNDSNAAVYPGAAELCADILVDNDCDGDTSASEASDSESYYEDVDHDGFGSGDATKSCTPIEGSVTNNSDCYPNEITYDDNDLDGFGAGAMVPCGSAMTSDDCDDGDPTRFPGAAELCANDGVDNDCDGEADDDAEASDSVSYYADADQDGFGLGEPVKSCTPIDGKVTNNDDCYPNDVTYTDADGDGHGTGAPVACGSSDTNDDCDDSNPSSYPGNPEICADEIDNDCNGEVDGIQCIPFELMLVSDVTSLRPGDSMTVMGIATNPPVPVRGLQLALGFDASRLEALSITAHEGSPFPNVLGAPIVDNEAGTILVMFVPAPGGPSMTEGAILFDVTFAAKSAGSFCGAPELVYFTEVDVFSTQFATIDGDMAFPIVPVLTDLPPIDLDQDGPVLVGIPAFDSVIPADAGILGAAVAYPSVTASDNCDGDGLAVTVIGWPEDGVFPIGSTIVSWSAIDVAGNETVETRTITIGNFQLLDVTVGFEGTTLPDGASRSIRVSVLGSTTVSTVLFPAATTTVQVIPAVVGDGFCVLVKDRTHSLARSGSAVDGGTRYSMNAVLRQGDSDDNNAIDVLDYALWDSDYSPTAARDGRSNFDGDTDVDLVDRAYIAAHVFETGDSCGTGFAPPTPVTRISLKELRRQGLGFLAESDRNHDGWLDARDFAFGIAPR